MTKVSVIIPVYNRENHISKCLNSVLNQSLEDYEIIVIDDGSTDGSMQIVSEISKDYKNIKMISQKNSGVSIARNRGIKEASGEFLIFVDSDDTLSVDALKSLYKTAVDSDSDFVYGDFHTIDELKKRDTLCKSKHIEGTNKELITAYLNDKVEPRIGSFIVSKKVIDQNSIEFYPKCRYGEDREFIAKCIIYSKTSKYLEKPVYYYYLNNQSTVKKPDILFFDCVDANIRIKEILFSEFSEDENVISSIKYALFEQFKYCVFMLACNGLKYSIIKQHLIEKKYCNYLLELYEKDSKANFKKILFIKHNKTYFYYIVLKNKIKRL